MHIRPTELARNKDAYLPHADGTPAFLASFPYNGTDRLGEVKEIHDDHILLFQTAKNGEPETGYRRFNFDKITTEIELTEIP